MARQAGISGVVRLNVVITKAGKVTQISVLTGHPALVPAAVEAVKNWVYQPTLLSGEPVDVATTVTVNFSAPISSDIVV